MKSRQDDVCPGCRRAVETIMTAVLLIGLYDVIWNAGFRLRRIKFLSCL